MKRALVVLLAACSHGAGAPPDRGPAASVSITASGVALSPTDADAQLAVPIARAIAKLDGVAHVSTTSAAHAVTVTAWLAAGADAKGVAARVESAAEHAVDPHAPFDFFGAPAVHDGGEVARVRASSGSLPAYTIRGWLDSDVVPALARDPDVVAIDSCGGSVAGIEIHVDPGALAAAGLTVGDVAGALAAAHLVPRGNVAGARQDYTFATAGDESVLRGLAIAYRNGAPIRLSDLGTIDDHGPFDLCPLGDDRRTPIADVHARAGADTSALAERIDALARTKPAAIDARVVRAPIRFDVAIAGGADDGAARSLAAAWRAALANAPDVIAVEPDAAPALGWSIDRATVARLGVDDRELHAALAALQGGRIDGTLVTPSASLYLRVVAPESGAETLLVRARDATTVPLSAITARATGPGRVDRLDGAPAAIVRFEVAAGDDADRIAAAAIARARAAAPPPGGIAITTWREP